MADPHGVLEGWAMDVKVTFDTQIIPDDYALLWPAFNFAPL